MFGYIKPSKPQLRVWEYELFRASYCGLCHALGQLYGFIWRFFINYDFCYLVVLLSGAEGCKPEFCSRRCVASPFRKRQVLCRSAPLEFSADATVILTYHKIGDSVQDNKGIKRIRARILRLLAAPAYRRAAAKRPEFDALAKKELARLLSLEREGCPSLDRTADAFARILAGVTREYTAPGADNRRILHEALYHVGRWIYIADAWDDYDDDRREGAYNPIITRFQAEGALDDTVRETLFDTMELSAAAAARAVELLELGEYDGIVKNIVYIVMPPPQENNCDGVYRKSGGMGHGSL